MTLTSDHRRNVALLGTDSALTADLFDRMLLVSDRRRVGDFEESGILDVTPFNPDAGPGVSDIFSTMVWKDCQLNILRHPYALDPISIADPTLTVTDGVVVALPGADKLSLKQQLILRHCRETAKPTVVFLNDPSGLPDRYHSLIAHMSNCLPADVLQLHLPLIRDRKLDGIIDLIELQAYHHYRWRSDVSDRPQKCEMSSHERERATEARRALAAQVVDLDETALAAFLADEDAISAQTLRDLIAQAVSERQALPVLMGATFPGMGVAELLAAIVDFCPAPRPRAFPVFGAQKTAEFAARVHSVIETEQGPHTLVHILGGALQSGSAIRNMRRPDVISNVQIIRFMEETAHLVERAIEGDIIALKGALPCRVGDILLDCPSAFFRQTHDFYHPLFEAHFKCESEEEITQLEQLFGLQEARHSSFRVFSWPSALKLVLHFASRAQVASILQEIEHQCGRRLVPDYVGVLYREDLNKAITVEQQIKRQTGLNLYAYVQIEMGPGAAKGGLDFRTSLSSKALEASTFDAIQDGFSSAMQIRNRTGFPIHSLAADLIDMREHAVDSRPVAFQLVARMALETACDQAGTQLLEPIMRLEITALNAHHQEILQDLATCRATVQNIAQYENHMHLFVDIPLADLDGFLSRFGAADQKDRDFAVSFSHYAPVPKEEAPKVKASRAL